MIRRMRTLRCTISRSSSLVCNYYNSGALFTETSPSIHCLHYHCRTDCVSPIHNNYSSLIDLNRRYITSKFHTTATKNDTSRSSSNDEVKHATPYILTDVGEGIAEVEVLQWYVKVGDHVKEFDMLCDVQSDKANVPITSRYDGVVTKLCGNVGDMIKTGTPLMYISTDDAPHNEYGDRHGDDDPSAAAAVTLSSEAKVELEASESTIEKGNNANVKIDLGPPKQQVTSTATEAESPFKTPNSIEKVQTSPAVRKLARENDIDLTLLLPGSGPNGRILKSDIMKYVRSQTEIGAKAERIEDSGGPITTVQREPPQPQPLRGYARHMYKAMTDSLNVPHMMLGDEVTMTKLIEARNTLKKSTLYQTHQLPKLTYLPFFMKAASLALEDYPLLNSSLVTDIASENNDICIQEHPHHNIGVAMATSRGLVVAVVHHCESLSIVEIQQELIRLETNAKSGSLAKSDVTGATFSLSNIGVIGGTYTQPVVVPPTVAIGAIGKIQHLPRYHSDDELPTKTPLIHISWSADHRVVDGASLASFNNAFKTYVEQPTEMLLRMK